MRSQRGITSFDMLAQALKSEFGITVSSIEVHRMLRNRRKRNNEDYKEYLYSLMELGKAIKLDDMSLIECFVEGIPDSRQNKINLYQAKTIPELKEQIRVYEKVRCGRQQVTSSSLNQTTPKLVTTANQDSEKGKVKRCFKCGNVSHIANDCNQAQPKCLKGGQPGHRAADCRDKQASVKTEKGSVNTLEEDLVPKVREIGRCIFEDLTWKGVTFSALIDTGCDLCLIRNDILLMLGEDIELNNDKRRLRGISGSILDIVGSFTIPVHVDNLQLEVTFHAVRERDMHYSAIVGNSILKYVNLIVSEDLAEFKAKTVKDEVDSTSQSITTLTNSDLRNRE
ncbi:uncharacterized protein LOC125779382 [Bactrocera dorsalis]|uniref:Uncharacterized protein LOC125779382 n=1 Tax=Bactrocera dorsalis TaxID=27457 RepID=A0ABM3K5C4_BACDO|nr:uncharacterized protein LOC125779382 [Bactrocera dorsalis]XP_049316677.1 uncharacterized protein LOC125779382 [Bactrocera dorsalis]